MAYFCHSSGYSKVKSFQTIHLQSFFGDSFTKPNNAMKDNHESEKLIGKLIKKRKDENEAFAKLLSAMGSKQKVESKSSKKSKS